METHADIRRAGRLSALTVGWNVLVGGGAVATALATGSLALIGFGINAVVDSSVSVLLVWRFHAEGRGHIERAERAEARAERLAGFAFLLIAAYLTIQSVRTLAGSGHAHTTAFGYTLALRIGSRALRADSMLTASGVALAAVALAALVAQRAFGWTWADAGGALVIAAILVWQGALTLRGSG